MMHQRSQGSTWQTGMRRRSVGVKVRAQAAPLGLYNGLRNVEYERRATTPFPYERESQSLQSKNVPRAACDEDAIVTPFHT